MKLVYLAGRYTGPTPERVELNIQLARAIGWQVRELGAYPVIPHLNTAGFEKLEEAVDWGPDGTPVYDTDYYYEGTLELMRRCDIVLMLPGWEASVGANEEQEDAISRGLPVVYSPEKLGQWLTDAAERELAAEEDALRALDPGHGNSPSAWGHE